MISKSEKLLNDELKVSSYWEYCFYLPTLFQSMLLMVLSFTFLILHQSEYLPNPLWALLIIWASWKSLDPKDLYSTKSLTFGYFWSWYLTGLGRLSRPYWLSHSSILCPPELLVGPQVGPSASSVNRLM